MAACSANEDIAALALGESIDAIARKPEAERSEIEKTALRSYFLANAAPPEIRAGLGKADGAPPGKRTTGSHLPHV